MTNKNLPAPILRAWAAGVFQAKCQISDRRNDLYFDSTDEVMLNQFVAVSGCGYVRALSPGQKKMVRTCFRWATKSLSDTRNTLLFVLPLLNDTKAAAAAKLIKRIEGNPTWQKRNGSKTAFG